MLAILELDQARLELEICLPLFPKGWDERHVLPLALFFFFF